MKCIQAAKPSASTLRSGLALSEILAQRKGARLQTLVIDEGFGSQDTQGRQRLIEAINLVKNDFAKILVITHLDELKDAFPNRIEVEKTERGSTLLSFNQVVVVRSNSSDLRRALPISHDLFHHFHRTLSFCGLIIIYWLHNQYHLDIVVKPTSAAHSNAPLISICIPARNEESNIRSCVEAILAQDYPNLRSHCFG